MGGSRNQVLLIPLYGLGVWSVSTGIASGNASVCRLHYNKQFGVRDCTKLNSEESGQRCLKQNMTCYKFNDPC